MSQLNYALNKVRKQRTETFYTKEQIANAVAKVFNIKKGFDVLCLFPHNEDIFTWDEINTTLFEKGWSPRHLLMLLTKLS